MTDNFLIPRTTVEKVTQALLAAIEHVDGDCRSSGCLCDLRKSPCSQFYKDALHHFETGLCKPK